MKGFKELEKELTIVTPSMSRASVITVTKVVPSTILVVPPHQLEDYKKHNPKTEVVAHPKECTDIGLVRFWIMNNWKNVFMLDDDVVQLRCNYTGKKIEGERRILEIILNNYSISKQMGVKLWGFSNKMRPVLFSSQNPIQLSGYLNGSYTGYNEGHEMIWLDGEGLAIVDDMFFSAYNAHKWRKCYQDNRYAFITKENFTSDGGCSEYRTSDQMVVQTTKLQELFGAVIVDKIATSTRKNVQRGERTLKLPF